MLTPEERAANRARKLASYKTPNKFASLRGRFSQYRKSKPRKFGAIAEKQPIIASKRNKQIAQ